MLRKRSRLFSHTIRVNFFRFLWIFIVAWGEIGAFYASLASCKWPVIKQSQEQPTHVLIASDTQVQHPSLMLKGSYWSGPLRQFIFDLNLKKNWHIARRMKAHTVFFLGDMLANGKSAKDKIQYKDAAHKFKSIFSTDPAVSVHYIPGNNDIGMGLFATSSNVRDYYFDVFGSFNRKVQINNHTFVVIDTPGLVDEDYLRAGRAIEFAKWQPSSDGTVAFVRNLAAENSKERQHLVLLSHIPLSRPDTASCGSMREKGTIKRGVGHGFQNMLGRETTSFLLHTLQPEIIFSADNRDYCDYTHTLPWTSEADVSHLVREITVKSFSMSVHIRKPGFQLLSVVNPSTVSDPGGKPYGTSPCFLPDQYGIYASIYFPIAILTCLSLLIFNIATSRRRSKSRPSPISFTQSSPRLSVHPPTTPLSPIWSPHTPALSTYRDNASHTNITSSPRPKLFRLPSSTSTLPPSPLLSPQSYITNFNGEDDETAPYTPHYAVHRTPSWKDEEWSIVEANYHYDYQETENTDSVKEALYASNSLPSEPSSNDSSTARSRDLSWAFVFRGRVRRLTLKAPSWESCVELGPFLSLFIADGSSRIRGGILKDTARDIVTVFWPALFIGAVITWIMM
ncbi:hypothetical protein BDQ17DRAFT_1343946 [Cyathus striatus]|nr:hypothetical protein BDQ17DRAFT_1343946 [Cyathus striatus]